MWADIAPAHKRTDGRVEKLSTTVEPGPVHPHTKMPFDVALKVHCAVIPHVRIHDSGGIVKGLAKPLGSNDLAPPQHVESVPRSDHVIRNGSFTAARFISVRAGLQNVHHNAVMRLDEFSSRLLQGYGEWFG